MLPPSFIGTVVTQPPPVVYVVAAVVAVGEKMTCPSGTLIVVEPMVIVWLYNVIVAPVAGMPETWSELLNQSVSPAGTALLLKFPALELLCEGGIVEPLPALLVTTPFDATVIGQFHWSRSPSPS